MSFEFSSRIAGSFARSLTSHPSKSSFDGSKEDPSIPSSRSEAEPPAKSPGQNRGWDAVALLFVLVSFASRLTRLSAGSLWGDEGYTMVTSTYQGWDIPSAFPIGRFSLYYHLIHSWMSVAGGSELASRYLSVWSGVATIAIAYAVGRRVGGSRTGLTAALLVVASPSLVDYSQIARPYALVVFLLGLSCYALLRVWQAPRVTRWWILATLSAVAAGYCHLFALTALPVTFGVFAVVGWREARQRIKLALAAIGVALALAPWLVDSFTSTFHKVAERAAPTPPTPLQYLTSLRDGILVGTIYPGGNTNLALIGLVTVLCLLIGSFALWSRPSAESAIVTASVLVPIVAGFAIIRVIPYFDGRYLLFITVPAVAIIGSSIGAIRRPFLVVLAVPVLCLAVLSGSDAYQQLVLSPREDLRPLAAELRARVQPGDVLIVNSTWRQLNLDYYIRSLRLPTSVVLDGPPASSEGVQKTLDRLTKNRQRVWVVLYGAPEGTAHGYIGTILRQRYAEVLDRHYSTTELALFQAPPPDAEPTPPVDAAFGNALKLVSRRIVPKQSVTPGAAVVVPMQVELETPGSYGLSLRLVGRNGQVWAQADAPIRPTPTAIPREKPSPLTRGLTVPLGTPPGIYHLKLVAYNEKTSKQLGVRVGTKQSTQVQVNVGRVAVRRAPSPPPVTALPMAHPLSANAGPFRLLGGDWPTKVAAGASLDPSLYWQAKSAVRTSEASPQTVEWMIVLHDRSVCR